MTDEDRANKAVKLLDQAIELLLELDSDLDPLVTNLRDEIQSVADDIESELEFDDDGSLVAVDDDDDDLEDLADPEDDDDEEDDEDDL